VGWAKPFARLGLKAGEPAVGRRATCPASVHQGRIQNPSAEAEKSQGVRASMQGCQETGRKGLSWSAVTPWAPGLREGAQQEDQPSLGMEEKGA